MSSCTNIVHIENKMLMKSWNIFAVLGLILHTNAKQILTPACKVFCRGRVLEVVQTSGIYPDSKVFVDMPIKVPMKKLDAIFNKMMEKTNGHPNKVQVRRFVRACFSPAGRDIVTQHPIDWIRNPKFLNDIRDSYLKEWAESLVYYWRHTGRRVSLAVRKNPHNHSVIYVPNLVVAPGGRLREYYYWDSYWIILGLLRSEMYQTVKGMIVNYLILIETYGFVPNSGRIYSLTRSNCPLLIPMVNEYYKVTNDTDFIKKNINTLEKEINFWLDHRLVNATVEDKLVKVARYTASAGEPRPDSYTFDTQAAKNIKRPEDRIEFFNNLVAAVESGWDFSSRWLARKSIENANLSDVITSSIAPVDLNAVLCWNARILEKFYTMLNIPNKASIFQEVAAGFQNVVADMMWNEEDGIWYDYDIKEESNRRYFYASNFFPLWTGCYDSEKKDLIGSRVTNYLKSNNIENFKGGIPASLVHSRLHWDYPNAIAPMQHLIITGLRETGNKDAIRLALKLADNWIHSTYTSYTFTKLMFDKYHAEQCGGQGYDEQVPIQVGYGWTNGVCLELLHIYGKQIFINPDDEFNAAHYSQSPLIFSTIFINLMLCFRTSNL